MLKALLNKRRSTRKYNDKALDDFHEWFMESGEGDECESFYRLIWMKAVLKERARANVASNA